MANTMNRPIASSLFHFTDSLEVLKAIITNGLLFSYSYEEHDFLNLPKEDLPDFKGIAIPMVCFCNTPLSRAENHARVYGKYYIALDKEFILDIYNPILNPVIYYSSENLARSIFCLDNTKNILQCLFLQSVQTYANNNNDKAEQLVKIMSGDGDFTERFNQLPFELRDNITSINDYSFAADFILGLSKPIYGKNKLGEDTFLDEEREWRAFLIDRYDDSIRWRFYPNKNSFEEDKENLKQLVLQNKNCYLTIPALEWSNMITSICTEKESQIPELVNFILSAKTLFGFPVTKETEYIKNFLLSRLTSFERLSNDI